MTDYEPETNEYGQIVAGLCEFCTAPIRYEADGDWDGERFLDCGTWVTLADDSYCPESPWQTHGVLL